jgi:hypothetical protein
MPGNEPSEDLSRDELYELAQDRDIVGRSSMDGADADDAGIHRSTTSGRSIWSGYISFGLVTIPVGLYSAVVALAPKEPEGAEVVDLTEVARRSVEESQARESA